MKQVRFVAAVLILREELVQLLLKEMGQKEIARGPKAEMNEAIVSKYSEAIKDATNIMCDENRMSDKACDQYVKDYMVSGLLNKIIKNLT